MNTIFIVRPAPGWEKPRFNMQTGEPEASAGAAVDLSAWGEGTWVLNPTDRAAIDAVQELSGAGEDACIALALSAADPAAAPAALYEALARGADRAILFTGEVHPVDPLAAAMHLAVAIRRLIAGMGGIDLVVCGAEAPDGAPDALAPLLAAALGWPQVTAALAVQGPDPESGRLTAWQEWDGAVRQVTVQSPAVISFQAPPGGPTRYMPGARVLAAFRGGEIETWSRARLEPHSGEPEPAERVAVRRNALADAPAGERLTGPVEESVAVLLQGLKGQGLY